MPYTTLPMAQWLPDQAAIDSPGLQNIQNVLPRANSYVPFGAFQAYSTSALTAYARGLLGVTDSSNVSRAYAGDQTKLYQMTGSLSWGDVTNTGGAYALGAEDYWHFVLFGNKVVALAKAESPQVFTVGTSAQFADLAGSPPNAQTGAVIRDQLWVGNISSDPLTVQWCDTNDITDWSGGLADSQTFPGGGQVQAILGGEFGLIFQKNTIRRATFVGGDVIYQIDEIAEGRGLYTPRAIARRGWDVWYLDEDGFYFMSGTSGEFRPIGAERVNRTFFADLDPLNIHRIVASVDPLNQVVMWAYPSVSSVDGTPDKLLVYNYAVDRWSRIEMTAQALGEFRTLSVDWDTLDSIYSSIDEASAAFDSALFSGGARRLVAFNSSNQIGDFSGSNLEAIVATGEVEPNPGGRVHISNAIPVSDTTAATVAIGTRERYGDSISYTAEASMERNGTCPTLANGRSATARVTIPAGTDWNHISAVRVEGQPSGYA